MTSRNSYDEIHIKLMKYNSLSCVELLSMYMIHYIIFYIVKFSVDRCFSIFVKWKKYACFKVRIIEQYLHCIFFVKRFALLRFDLIERKGIE